MSRRSRCLGSARRGTLGRHHFGRGHSGATWTRHRGCWRRRSIHPPSSLGWACLRGTDVVKPIGAGVHLATASRHGPNCHQRWWWRDQGMGDGLGCFANVFCVDGPDGDEEGALEDRKLSGRGKGEGEGGKEGLGRGIERVAVARRRRGAEVEGLGVRDAYHACSDASAEGCILEHWVGLLGRQYEWAKSAGWEIGGVAYLVLTVGECVRGRGRGRGDDGSPRPRVR